MAKISFEEAIADSCTMNMVISPNCKTRIDGKFTILRVDRNTVPSDWYAYDVIHGDQGGMLMIKELCGANCADTFLTQQKVKIGPTGERYLTGRGGYAIYRGDNT